MKRVSSFLAAIGLACVSATIQAQTLEVIISEQGSGKPVPGAVVTLANGTAPAPGTGQVVQQDRAFKPDVLVVPQGSSVDFPNLDNTQHHVYSFSPAKPFNIELYAGQPEAPVLFDQAGIVELGCNIHDQMKGFIVVTDSALVARSDKDGIARLELGPGADSHVNVWHPRLADNTQPVRIEREDRTSVIIQLKLTPNETQDDPLNRLQKRFREL